ncbi:MAG: hypothetical protein FWH56_09280, partial [Betaproteobacteria bacterium]|nr:hypothetical protein [Betaproteobacteria bacterium]
MKHLFFLPFLFCTLLGCQTNPARNGTPVIKVLRVDKVEFSEYSVGSFEPPSACEGFELSEADLSEFFQKARSLPNESVASYRKRQLSRCQINGTAILEDGNEVSFTIDRARNAGLTMKNVKAPSPLKDGLYHCAECTSDKFYPSEWQASSDRPIIKSITISNNGFFTGDEKAYPNACDDFILTKDDVHEFFKGALPISISKYQYI